MGEHTVTSFDDDLEEVDGLVVAMGQRACDMVEQSVMALTTADTALAQRVISEDAVMDSLQRELDDKAVTLIAKRQPVAQDLRLVIGAMRMGGDLERIGDLAKNIAKRVGVVDTGGARRDLAHGIEQMARLVREQVGDALALYKRRDGEALAKLRDRDEAIDIAYTGVFRELLTYMMEDVRQITACTHLLFCAKNLERIGDHVTNIAENAYYTITGDQLSANRPKRDETVGTAA